MGAEARVSDYRLWVSEDRCVLLRIWGPAIDVTTFKQNDDGKIVEVATRQTPAHTWGPPVSLYEEKV